MKKRFSTRKLCLLAVFTAITVILAIYATFRIGNQIKIPLKFITVFMTGAIFGAIPAGIVAALADILNAVLVPVGPWLPQITAVEFLYGVIYGAFFYKAADNKFYYLRTLLCCLIQFGVSITLMSKILTDVGYFSSFYAALIIRMPAAIVTFLMHMAVLCALKKIIFRMKNYFTKEEI